MFSSVLWHHCRNEEPEATFEAENGGTTVSLFFKGIPWGIRSQDNEVGTQSRLEKLARYVEEGEP